MAVNWNEYLDSLAIWASDRGYCIDFVRGGDTSICHISKSIEINSSCSPEKQVIYLLHECGHALIFENGSVYDFESKRDLPKYTVASKVYTVIEEAEAWRRGRDLAKRLCIPIDDEEYEKSMIKALKKYINWASDLKEKKRVNKG